MAAGANWTHDAERPLLPLQPVRRHVVRPRLRPVRWVASSHVMRRVSRGGCGRKNRPLDMQPNGCMIRPIAREPDDADKVFKALADPVRRVLLDRLRRENGQTLGHLAKNLDMTRQAVSKHLAVLEGADLVAVVWRGREKLHYLNPVPIHDIAERWIGRFERGRLDALAELRKRLEGERDG